MPAIEIAYVPTRMALEAHPAIDFEIYLLLQRRGAGEQWTCIRQSDLAHALAKSLSSIRRALRRLAAAGYVAIRHRVVIGGRVCTSAYRVLYGRAREGALERLSYQTGHDEQPLSRQQTHDPHGAGGLYGR